MNSDPLPYAMFEGMNGDIAVAIATLPGRPSGEASIVLRMAAGAVEAAELHRGLFRGSAERFPAMKTSAKKTILSMA